MAMDQTSVKEGLHLPSNGTEINRGSQDNRISGKEFAGYFFMIIVLPALPLVQAKGATHAITDILSL
jgi:hypothetical protein